MTAPEFTGERFIPGLGGAQIAYEHLHRYLFASRWAAGKDVLDVAAGAGYGAALLAGCARRVYALDVDAGAVRDAAGTWHGENLKFFRGDATRLPVRAGSADLVVAMEVIEHLDDQDGLVREMARVCREEGMVLISTPNKAVYSDARAYHNPFHTHEFARDEFLELLGRHFGRVRLFSQHVRAGSLIHSEEEGGSPQEILTSPVPAGSGPAVEPMYFLAVCSQRRLPEPLLSGSAYLDLTDGLLLERKEEIRRLGLWGKELEDQIKQRDLYIRKVLDEVEARDRTIVSEQKRYGQVIEGLHEQIVELNAHMGRELEARDRQIQEMLAAYERLHGEFEERGLWAKSLEEQIADLKTAIEHLARIRHHLLCRILCRLGLLPK